MKAECISDAAKVFAQRAARKSYGRNAVVGTLNANSYSQDCSLIEYSAFIGRKSGRNEVTGHNTRFTVCLSKKKVSVRRVKTSAASST